MPEPLRGLVAIGEYGSKFDADAVIARLESAGIRATASYDPAMNSVAPYFASDRTFEVIVHQRERAQAEAVLGGERADLPPEFYDGWESTTWTSGARQMGRGCLIAAMMAALALIIISLLAGFVLH